LPNRELESTGLGTEVENRTKEKQAREKEKDQKIHKNPFRGADAIPASFEVKVNHNR
jgi:hypothetical protein